MAARYSMSAFRGLGDRLAIEGAPHHVVLSMLCPDILSFDHAMLRCGYCSSGPVEIGEDVPLTVELDRSSPVPLYYQLAQAIEAAIRDGELAPGDRFENELALAKRLTCPGSSFDILNSIREYSSDRPCSLLGKRISRPSLVVTCKLNCRHVPSCVEIWRSPSAMCSGLPSVDCPSVTCSMVGG